MGAYLEVWTPAGRELVALEGGRLTLGADPANDLALAGDPALSRLHAVLERYGHLYDKFGIQGGGERRRVRLANEALRRGAATMAGLRQEVAWDNKRIR
jgi:hypothetical protein